MLQELILGALLVGQLAGVAIAVAALRYNSGAASEVRRLSTVVASLARERNPDSSHQEDGDSDLVELLESNLDGIWRQIVRHVRPRLDSVDQAREQFQRALTALGTELEERTGQLRRFRDGYDSSAARRMLTPFVRLHQDLRAEVTDTRTDDAQRRALTDVTELMRDALESAGVQLVQPRIGTDYRSSALAGDAPSFKPTDDTDLDWCIARVIDPAWVYESAGVETVLRKATVEVFRR